MAIKILYIEDEKDLAELVKAYLENNRFEVDVAYDGLDGLKKAGDMPDLIILDLMLPKMSGQEVLERLRFDQRTKNIPVIVLTARGESQTIFDMMKLGSFDYLIKPYEHKELLATIKRALNMSR
jgi:DNA-binding response OmpR family regulator